MPISGDAGRPYHFDFLNKLAQRKCDHAAKVLDLEKDVADLSFWEKHQLLRVPRRMAHMATPGVFFQPIYGDFYDDVRLTSLRIIAKKIIVGLRAGNNTKEYQGARAAVNKIINYQNERTSLGMFSRSVLGAKLLFGMMMEVAVILGWPFLWTMVISVPLLADSAYINQRFYDDCLWLLLHKEFLPDQLDWALENTRLLRNLPEGEEYVKHLKNSEEGLPLPKNICSRKINSDLRYIRSRNRVKAAVTLGVFIAVASVLLSNPITACAVSAYVMYAACGYLAASDIVDRCTKHQSLRGAVGTMFSCGKQVEHEPLRSDEVATVTA